MYGSLTSGWLFNLFLLFRAIAAFSHPLTPVLLDSLRSHSRSMPPRCRESSSAGVRPARPILALSRSLAPFLVCPTMNLHPYECRRVSRTDENTKMGNFRYDDGGAC